MGEAHDMAGLTREEYDAVAAEILTSWNNAETRDQGLQVIVEFGRKHGFKNVMAAIQGRTPKRFTAETSVSDWVEQRQKEEAQEG